MLEPHAEFQCIQCGSSDPFDPLPPRPSLTFISLPKAAEKLSHVPLFISSSCFLCLSFRSTPSPVLILLTSFSSSTFSADLFLPVLLRLLLVVQVSALSAARQSLKGGFHCYAHAPRFFVQNKSYGMKRNWRLSSFVIIH